MATTLTSNTFNSTYKDDFSDSDNFHRILFNSGRIVQARELTQAQTILQKQIERFGNNIFKEGAVIKAGGLTVNNSYEFIKLNNTSNALPTTDETINGSTFTSQDGQNIKVEVIETIRGSANVDGGTNPDTLYVRYVSTSGATAGQNTIRMPSGIDINNGTTTLTTASTGASGTGIRASVSSGIFYVKGHFVFTDNQSKIISKYSDTFSGDIGFKVIEQVVTADDNAELYDNQGASPNVAAPGADRYKITLTLAPRSEVTGSQNFVFLATLKEGSISKSVEQNDPFNVPSKVTAQRIKENSGDYVVEPFFAEFDTDSQNTHLLLNISDGIGIVDGFRIERNPSQIRVRKSNSSFQIQNDVTAFPLGNYVKVATGTDGNTGGLPDISTFEPLELRSAINYGGSKIGQCRVRAVAEDGSNHRFYLFDIKMNSAQSFSSTKSIGTSSSNYFNVILEGTPSVAVLNETEKNNLLLPLRHNRPSKIESISFAKQRYVGNVSVTSGAGAMPSLSGTETYANTNDWVFAKNDSDVHRGSVNYTSGGAGQTTANFTLGSPTPQNGTYEVLHYVNEGNAQIRSKTLTTIDSEGVTISTDSDGRSVLLLSKPDIYDVILIRDSDANGSVDISPRFRLDNGQRDNFYDAGRLVLLTGQSSPTGNVKVKYRYFEHGTGHFFALPSYDSNALGGYQNIPSHTLEDGTLLSLANVLDFRPVKNASTTNFSGGTTIINELPQPNDTIEANINYYNQQTAKLVLGNDGVLQFIRGEAAADVRTFPVTPEGTMPLYDVVMGANTLNDSDVLLSPVQNKRFTMKDIGTLEKRVERLEEAVSLSLLELDTKNIEVLDSAGTNRTRSGFVADNFDDQNFTAFLDPNYAAAIDPFVGKLHPTFNEDNIRLIYNHTASSNTVLKGDNVYIDYDSAEFLDASKASTSVKINPFDYAQYNGGLVLSPSSDDWRDVEKTTGKVANGGIQLDTKQAYLWNNHQWNWGGIPLANLTVGSRTTETRNATFNKVISDEKVKKLVNERVIETVLIPFQRSLKIHFKALGLRPNTQHFAFYDRQLVTDFVREETFVRHASAAADFGNKHKNATQHPEGKTDLISDANGTIEGSFFIPQDRFRTGTREFALIDVSEYTKEFAKSQSRANTNFSSSGTLEKVKQDFVTTRVLTIGQEKVPPPKAPPPPSHGNSDDNDNNHGANRYYDLNGNGNFNSRISNSDYNRMSSRSTNRAANSENFGGASRGRGGGFGSSRFRSDAELKTNIKMINIIEGIKLYQFNYLWDTATTYIGVMAQDLLGTKYETAVSMDKGYYMVDYSMLPVDMEELSNG